MFESNIELKNDDNSIEMLIDELKQIDINV